MKRLIASVLCIVLMNTYCATAVGETLILPDSLKAIEDESFYGDASLDEVFIPQGTEIIGNFAFAYSGVKKVHIPETVTRIGENVFEGVPNVIIYSPVSAIAARDYAVAYGLHWVNDGTEKDIADFEDFFDTWDDENGETGLLIMDEIEYEYLSADDFDTVDDDTMALIYEYNALIAECEAGYAAYQQNLIEFERVFESLNEAVGDTTIEANEDGMTITNSFMNLSITSDMEEFQAESLQSRAVVQHSKNARSAGMNIEGDEGFWNDLQQSFDNCNYAMMELEGVLNSTQQGSLLLADLAKTIQQTLNKNKAHFSSSRINALLRIHIIAEKSCRSIAKFAGECLEALKKLRLQFAGWGYSIGQDTAYWYLLNDMQKSDPHPTEREASDRVKQKYAEQWNEEINEAKNAYVKDALYNMGCLLAEVMIFGKGAPLKAIGKQIGNQAYKLVGKAWVRGRWAASLAIGLAMQATADKHCVKAEKIDDILHGRVRAILQVSVLDIESGKPLSGAHVTADDVSDLTDNDGTCILMVKFGDYSGENAILATLEGYPDASGEITVDAPDFDPEDDETLDFELTVYATKNKGVPFPEYITCPDYDLAGRFLTDDYSVHTEENGTIHIKCKASVMGHGVTIDIDIYPDKSPGWAVRYDEYPISILEFQVYSNGRRRRYLQILNEDNEIVEQATEDEYNLLYDRLDSEYHFVQMPFIIWESK